ncbi:MAG: hypothetical protein ACRD2T_14565, partial [Thermoanaerobaculia bacterium]
MTEAAPPLPGPGLDVPVDADGDGLSTYGDRYAFNYWLGLGGSLEKALSAASVQESGIIDLSAFFRSPDAVLAPQSSTAPLQESGGSVLTSSSTCATSASIVPPFGAPTTPASLFTVCEPMFKFPTAAQVDDLQGLWGSRGRPTDPDGEKGLMFLNLSQVPPLGRDGTIPLSSPVISKILGFGAQDLVLRELPPGGYTCETNPPNVHAMSN